VNCIIFWFYIDNNTAFCIALLLFIVAIIYSKIKYRLSSKHVVFEKSIFNLFDHSSDQIHSVLTAKANTTFKWKTVVLLTVSEDFTVIFT